MCNVKRLFLVTLYALILFNSAIDCKKTRKTKRQKEEQESTTPQPDVVTYSSFGYNEVGGSQYDGFVPSSPDYASFLSNYNQETTTRLYAPAFPTALDNIGPEGYNNYEPQTQEGQGFGPVQSSGQSAPGNIQYQDNSFNIVNGPSFPETNNLHYNQDEDDDSMPVYGTKISSKNKHNFLSQFNSTNGMFDGMPPSSYADNPGPYQNPQNVQSSEPSDMATESDDKNYNIYNYAPTYPTTSYNSDFETKPNSNNINYQKVVDFTKYKMPYPTELDHKYSPDTPKTSQAYGSKDISLPNYEGYHNSFKYQYNRDIDNIKPKYKESLSYNTKKPNAYSETSYNQLDFSNTKYGDSPYDKDETRKKPNNYNSNTYPTFKYAFKDDNTHYNIHNFTKYQQSNNAKPNPSNEFDIINSASSNVIDLTNYRFPKGSYSYFKDNNFQQDYVNEFKNLEANRNIYHESSKPKNVNNQGQLPAVSSYWGNSYKSYSTPSTFMSNYKKPQNFDEESEDIVHIPKKTQSHKYSKYHESKPYNSLKSKPSSMKYGMGKPIDEWNKEVATRFKSEEDLLGLRNQDTSHPSYLPTFKFNNDVEEFPKYASNFDYKATIEKWRQSYLKTKNKYKNWKNYDSDGLGSDVQPVHVPIMKPYPVEVPHPVIVPVPQPYPVRVPVPKPVAVPVVRELKVPIEKPVPYPVYKKVPYPVEKPVPVPVEKPIHVPVEKPYPVPIPHVRPVFHHARPTRDEADMLGDFEDHDVEEEYYPTRPRQPPRGPKKILIKKVKSSRSSRRPTPSYPERSRRRWPPRRPSSSRSTPQRSRSPPRQYTGRHREFDPEILDHEQNDYYDYCRRNGNC